MNLNLNKNLLGQTRPIEPLRPKGFFALIILDALTILLSGIFGYCALAYTQGRMSFLPMILSALAFFVISPFPMILSTSVKRRLGVILIEAIAFLVFFYRLEPVILLAALAVILLFSFWGDGSARAELEERLRFSFSRVAHTKIAKMFTGFLLAGIILTMPQWRSSALPIPEQQFRILYDQSLNTLHGIYSGIDLDVSVQRFAEDMAKKQLEEDRNFKELPPNLQAKALRDAAAIEIAQASKNLNLEILPAMRVSDVLYIYITNFIVNWKAGLGDKFIVVWAVVLFLLLRGLGFIMVWAALILGACIYQLLAALGLVSIIGESVTRERLLFN